MSGCWWLWDDVLVFDNETNVGRTNRDAAVSSLVLDAGSPYLAALCTSLVEVSLLSLLVFYSGRAFTVVGVGGGFFVSGRADGAGHLKRSTDSTTRALDRAVPPPQVAAVPPEESVALGRAQTRLAVRCCSLSFCFRDRKYLYFFRMVR